MEAESRYRPSITGYGMVRVEALNNLLQPATLLRCCLMLSLP
jgi:hypothetical protein